MTIQITQPEIEALINHRLETGAFRDAEDVILQAFKSSEPSARATNRTRADAIERLRLSVKARAFTRRDEDTSICRVRRVRERQDALYIELALRVEPLLVSSGPQTQLGASLIYAQVVFFGFDSARCRASHEGAKGGVVNRRLCCASRYGIRDSD
jgi:hypothetical protein